MVKGVIVQLFDGNNPLYFYCPFNYNESEFEKWKINIIESNTDSSWIQDIYWYLDEYSCVLVDRNKEWFRYNIDEIKNIWNKII